MLTYRTTALVAALLISSVGHSQAADSTLRSQQRLLDSLAAELRTLRARVDSAQRSTPTDGVASATPRAAGAYMNVSFVGLTDAGWSTSRDIPSLQRGHHDPRARGFTIPNAEISLDGAVDPFFKGVANIVYNLDENGETNVELEEAYFLTTALPRNLQVMGGQFNVLFGRENALHPHSWSFVDQPVVLNRMFGPDGLRSQGLRVSWLLPTRFYTEATLTVGNSAGETAFSFRSAESAEIHAGTPVERGVRGAGDLLYVPHLATSFDLTSNQTLLLGASGAYGPNNSGATARTTVVGGDLYWKWKSATAHQGFPFVAFQAEGITRGYDAAERTDADAGALPRETLRDHGGYAQLLWGIKPLTVLALRAESASGNRAAFDVPLRAARERWSANVTWYPSEYSKLRVQYNLDRRAGLGRDHSIWLQAEFLLGAHAAHKF